MLHAVRLFAVLYGTWIVLSGHFTPFLLIAGAICAALTVAITLRMEIFDHQRARLVPLWRLPFYLLWLAWQIILWSLILPCIGIPGGFTGLASVRLLFGATQSGAYPSLSKVTHAWFPAKSRTIVQGWIATFFGRGGGAMSSIILGTVLMKLCGLSWQWSLVWMGMAGLAFGVLFLVFFRNSPEEHPRVNRAEIDLINEGRTPAKSTDARVLPWRFRPGQTPDPYHVWLSEIMLQQTTVATVGPYFDKFLKRWPQVSDLAAAELDDVLANWAGLGYYARARNLHRCAQVVSRDHGGSFPGTEAALLTLPGIGPYTAAAIAAIALFGEVNMLAPCRTEGESHESRCQSYQFRPIRESRQPEKLGATDRSAGLSPPHDVRPYRGDARCAGPLSWTVL